MYSISGIELNMKLWSTWPGKITQWVSQNFYVMYKLPKTFQKGGKVW